MIGRGRDLSIERNVLQLEVRSQRLPRLDHWLVDNLPWRSRSRLQALIRAQRVLVNDRPAKPSQRVHEGDHIEIRLSSGVGVPADYSSYEPEILYEDEWLVAVNKPAGLLVHPVGRHVYDTLMNYLHWRYHDAANADSSPERGVAGARRRTRGRPAGADEGVVPRLCHRLDRDTTGVVVVAKRAFVHREVSGQFERRQVGKRYLAIAEGRVPRELGSIDTPIGEARSLRGALEHQSLKPSRTEVEVVEYAGAATLLRCTPHTGRQNQIRIHLAAAGFPILGDARYRSLDGPEENAEGSYWLHSELLRFWHPRLKVRVEIAAPPPSPFLGQLERLRADGDSQNANLAHSPLTD